MTKTFKKSLALILSVIMLMSVMPMSFSLAAETVGLAYSYTGYNSSSRVATVTGYTGSATEVEIPDTTTNGGNSYKVTTIGTSNNNNNYGRPFYNNVNITKVTLGNNVKTINSNAFSGCTNLETIVIPTNLSTVGANAFAGCSKLTTVNYTGGSTQWNSLVSKLGNGNEQLKNATVNLYYGHDCSRNSHKLVAVSAIGATCTENGNKAYWTCEVYNCKKNFSDAYGRNEITDISTTVIPAAHLFTNYVTNNDATCTQDGTETATCDRNSCNETYTRTVVNSALGHNMAPATCTEPSKCQREGCNFTIGDAKGHNRGVQGVDYIYIAPTCQRAGFQEDIFCVDCGAFIEIGKTLTQLDHTYVKDNEKSWNATCDDSVENKKGRYYGVCSMCGDIKDEILPALEHNYEVWNESDLNPATCVSLGTELSSCTVCGKIAERPTLTFNYNNHTNLVFNEAEGADCENDGNVAYWECEGCNNTYSDEAATELLTTVVVSKINHNYGDTWEYDEEAGKHKQTCANDATHINWGDCEDSETDTDCLCDICGHIVAHNFADATCTAPATCRVCGAITGTADLANHTNLTHTDAVAPDCTTDGNIEYWECEGCDKIYSDAQATNEIQAAETVDLATGHDYGEYVYDAETEKHYAVCANDEEHIDSDFCMNTNPEDDCECDGCYRVMDHDFALANCIAPATCRVCGEEDGEINPENHIGHSIVEPEEYREATCVSAEYTKNVTRCLGCGEVLETEEITGEINPDNHQIKQVIPNNGKDKEHYFICEREGCDYKENIDHDLSYPTIIDEATCTKKGRLREYCSICTSYIYTEIDMIPHVDANKNAKCDVCDKSLETPEDTKPDTPTPENPAPEEPSETCPCNCHKSGLMGLFFKFILFFQKFFGINKMCDCGKAHY